MAPLLFKFRGAEVSCELEKIDRSKLYGMVKKVALDANGRPCRMVTLAGDGRTLIDSGGTAMAYFTPDGTWADKGQLKPVDLEGKEVKPVPSTFKAPVELAEKVSFDDFFSHNISSVYRIEGSVPDNLLEELKSGVIYGFPFSYRGGLQADRAFLLAGGDGHTVWLLIGKRQEIVFVGIEQVIDMAEEAEEASGEEEDDSLDFGMM